MIRAHDVYADVADAERVLKTRSPSVGRLMVQGDRPHSLVTIGTAFVIRVATSLRLVTAGHVIDDLVKELSKAESDGMVVVRFGSAALLLKEAPFRIDRKSDIATAPLDLTASLELRRTLGVPMSGDMTEEDFVRELLQSAPDLTPPSSQNHLLAGFLGFPAPRNEYHPQAVSANNPSLQILLLERHNSSVASDITFEFDRNNLRSLGRPNEKLSAPRPHGMSGGPFYWLVQTSDGWKTELGGVALDYYCEKKLLGASSVEKLIEHIGAF